MRNLATSQQLRVIDIPELGREIAPWSDLVSLVRLYRIMRRERPDIVHSHLAKAGFSARMAARLAGVPIVLHSFHGNVFRGYFSPAKSRFFLLLEQFGARLSTRLITSSPRLRDDLIEFGVSTPARIAVIPYGFHLDALAQQPRFQGSFRSRIGLSQSAKIIGTVGRLVSIKNLPLLLDAAALVRQHDQEISFAVVGDGELRGELESRAQELGLGDSVVFAGWQPDLLDVYADLDALVLSSDNEGTPVSLIEAMAAGCPVVATSVGGVPDLVTDGETGRLVPRGDSNALANAILAVFNEPDRTRAMADQARKQVLERHQARDRDSDVARLYQSLLLGAGYRNVSALATSASAEGQQI